MITLYQGPGSNIRIDGSRYKKGIFGLAWFPSDAAKQKAKNYEDAMFSLLSKLYFKFTSCRVLMAIYQQSPKIVTIMPRYIDGSDNPEYQEMIVRPTAQEMMCNAQAEPADQRRSYVKGQTAPGPGESPFDTKLVGTGEGCDAVVKFNPSIYPDFAGSCVTIPGFRSEDTLLHELIHAMAALLGKRASSMAGPNGFTNLEEFTAITIANVYVSETGRTTLRGDHSDGILKGDLTIDRNYYEKYKRFMNDLCANHRWLAAQLKLGANIIWNPFKYCDA